MVCTNGQWFTTSLLLQRPCDDAVTCRKEIKQLFLCFYGKRRQFHNWKTICTHIFPRSTRLWIKGTALLFSFWQYHHKCLLHGLAVKDHKILWYLLDFLPLWITICNYNYIHTFFQEFLSLECKVQLWYFYFCNIITSVVCMALQFLKGQTDVRFISK